MKKLLSVILAAMMLSLVFAATALATPTAVDVEAFCDEPLSDDGELMAISGTCGDNLIWTHENGVLTISGEGTMTDYSSNSSVPWYNILDSVKFVVIKDGVTSIGKYAFYWCKNLESVTIGSGVTYIGSSSFSGCISLNSVNIPDSVTSIGSGAFSGCSSLEEINVDENNTKYSSDERGVLFNKDKTTLIQYPAGNTTSSYEISDSVTKIEMFAFGGCDNLEMINVDENNEAYSSDRRGVLFDKFKTTLFKYPASNIETVYKIPDGVAFINSGAFRNCTNLVSVTIPDSFGEIIDTQMFYGCSSLENINIPDGVTSIGSSAFSACSSLTSIIIPDSVTSIGYSAFMGCSSLVGITIPDSVTSIGFQAFDECSSPVIICNERSYAETYAKNNGIRYIYFGQEIEEKMTGSCGTNLTYSIQNGVLTISGKGTMCDYNSLNKAPWSSVAGLIKSVVIEDGVTSIGRCAFYECRSIKSVTFPESLISVGDWAFAYCVGLESIVVPDGVTSIGEMTFAYCGKMKSLTVGKGVNTIGEEAFLCCSSLESIHLPDSTNVIGERAFSSCTSLKAITVDENNTKYANDERGVLFNKKKTKLIQYPTGNSAISYEIPGSVTNIGTYSFAYNKSLETIAFPDNIIVIEEKAFFFCGIRHLSLPARATLEDSVFQSNQCLETVVLEDGFTSIPSKTFADCPRIEKIVIPKSVTSIAEDAFSNWKCLKIYGYQRSCARSYAVDMSIPFETFAYLLGDLTGDEEVDVNDALLLLQHSISPSLYPLDYIGSVDFTGDGTVDLNDAILLLQHSMFPSLYPIE